MSALIDFKKLVVGNEYARKELAEVWGYQGFQGLSRGVITPRKSNVIILFVTTGLFKLWDGRAVNSIHIPELLRASHIKPWKSSDAAERLDPYNGLLLSPIFDTLFDKGFISFDDHGKILLSKQIMDSCEVLSLSGEEKLVKVYNSNKVYLEYHREHVFLK